MSEEAFSEELKAGRERDLRFGQSYTGPHRDDFCVRVNDIDIRKYGSQGQQRTAALSLKLAEIRLVEEEIHDTPVLLLDDVCRSWTAAGRIIFCRAFTAYRH